MGSRGDEGWGPPQTQELTGRTMAAEASAPFAHERDGRAGPLHESRGVEKAGARRRREAEETKDGPRPDTGVDRRSMPPEASAPVAHTSVKGRVVARGTGDRQRGDRSEWVKAGGNFGELVTWPPSFPPRVRCSF